MTTAVRKMNRPVIANVITALVDLLDEDDVRQFNEQGWEWFVSAREPFPVSFTDLLIRRLSGAVLEELMLRLQGRQVTQ